MNVINRKKYILTFLLIFGVVFTGFSSKEPVKNNAPLIQLDKKKDKEKKRKEKEKLARQFYTQRQYDKAIDIFDEIYWDYPTYTNYIYYSYSLIGIGNYKKAEKVIRNQIKKHPDNDTFKVDLGALLMNLGQKKKAEKIYLSVIKNLKKSKGAIQQIASRFSSKQEDDYALKTYFKGRELLKKESLFSREIAKIYEKKGDYEQMFDEYLAFVSNDEKKIGKVTWQLQQMLNKDKNREKSKRLYQTLLKRVRQEPDNKIYNELISWLSIQQKDYETALIYVKSLENRFDYKGKKIFELGRIALENHNYEVAEQAFSFYVHHMDEKHPYYIDAHILQLTAKYEALVASRENNPTAFETLESDLQQLIDNFPLSEAVIPSYVQLAEVKNYYLNKPDEAIQLLANVLEKGKGMSKKAQSKIKVQLAKLYLYNDNPWEATLLYSQVEKALKNTPIANQAKYDNAMLSYYIGEFDWAKAKFDILKASTSKLIANDALYMSLFLSENMSEDSTHNTLKRFAKADLLFLRKQVDQSLLLLDSLEQAHESDLLTDDILYKKAQILEYQKHYKEADSIYSRIYTEYNYDLLADNALMQSINLNLYQLKDDEKAKELLKKMLKDYEGSLFTHKSRIIFRKLRNDKIR